jgi:hypothetical protein
MVWGIRLSFKNQLRLRLERRLTTRVGSEVESIVKGALLGKASIKPVESRQFDVEA